MADQTTSSAPITGPLFEGGYDISTGLVRGFRVDAQGQLYIANPGGGGGTSGLTPVSGSVSISPLAVSYTDNSGTIASGGVSQQISGANANRHVLLFFNLNALGGNVMYLNFGTAATSSNSIPVYPGGGWQSDPQNCPSGSINVLGLSTGDKYMEKEN